jgi:hypothetical protein
MTHDQWESSRRLHDTLNPDLRVRHLSCCLTYYSIIGDNYSINQQFCFVTKPWGNVNEGAASPILTQQQKRASTFSVLIRLHVTSAETVSNTVSGGTSVRTRPSVLRLLINPKPVPLNWTDAITLF